MSRRARLDLEGYFYHLVCRGQRKQPLFFSPADRASYFAIINETLRDHDIEIFAYCLMTNHVHLLVRRNKHELSTFMKKVNTKYAMYFNKKYSLSGHVFQGRYYDKIILNETYLSRVIKYIHLNPVEAGMVRSASDFRYSSASVYEHSKKPDIVRLSILKQLNTSEKYHRVISLEHEPIPELKYAIGTKDEYLKLEKRRRKESLGKFREKRAVTDNRIKEILEKMGINKSDLKEMKYSRKRRDEVIKIYRKLLTEGISRAEIARYFEVNKSTVIRALNSEKKK